MRPNENGASETFDKVSVLSFLFLFQILKDFNRIVKGFAAFWSIAWYIIFAAVVFN